MKSDRNRIIFRTSIVGIIVNFLLAGFKAIFGWLSNSIAITLDAVNNLTDALSSVITIIGTWIAKKDPDKKHPFGHGRTEYISTLAIGVIIAYAGVTAFIESVKNIINPSMKRDVSFDSLHNKAFKGSTYEKARGIDWYLVTFILVFVICIGAVVLTVVLAILRHIKLNKFYKDVNYFRDTPNGGHMAMTHAIFTDFDIWNSKDCNVIGAIILKMIKDKNIEPLQSKSVGFFGMEKIETSLKLVKEPEEETVKELYNIIKNAAGPDGVLQENELKNYAKINYIKGIKMKYLNNIRNK